MFATISEIWLQTCKTLACEAVESKYGTSTNNFVQVCWELVLILQSFTQRVFKEPIYHKVIHFLELLGFYMSSRKRHTRKVLGTQIIIKKISQITSIFSNE